MLWDIFFAKRRYECWTGRKEFGRLRQHAEVIYKGLCDWDLYPGVSGKPSIYPWRNDYLLSNFGLDKVISIPKTHSMTHSDDPIHSHWWFVSTPFCSLLLLVPLLYSVVGCIHFIAWVLCTSFHTVHGVGERATSGHFCKFQKKIEMLVPPDST